MADVPADALASVLGVRSDEIPVLAGKRLIVRSGSGYDLVPSVRAYIAHLRSRAETAEASLASRSRDPWDKFRERWETKDE